MSFERLPIPTPEQDWHVPWDALQEYSWVQAWKSCPQDPIYHAEGNVWIHTRMVLEAMAADPGWRALSPADRECAYLGAVLHDLAKPQTTRVEPDGRVSARGHSKRGAIMARKLLWTFGYPFALREAICGLIRFHQVPYFLIEKDDAERRLASISQRARCDLLYHLSRADITGRICADAESIFERIELFGLYARELSCWRQPLGFPSSHGRVLFFQGRRDRPDDPAYDDTQFEVVLMSGLPGSGKDTWIARNLPDHPVVSLDRLRAEQGVAPTDNQGRIRQAALEQARVHLRRKEPFVWNATNLGRQRRAPLVELFLRYHASVRIVYVEAAADHLFDQNRQRDDWVPRPVIERMMGQWEVPDLTEAHRVDHVVQPAPP